MNKILRAKWLVVFLAICVMIFFGRSVSINVLTDNAVVLGMGIDYTEEGYDVSIQSIIPQASSSGNTSTKKYVVFSATDKSLSGALALIGEKMGMIISLTHCNIIIVSKDALEIGLNEEIQNLVNGWFLTLHALIVGTEEKPIDILSAETPVSVSSAEYLQTLLLESISFSNLTRYKVKDYIVDNYTQSAVSAIAFLERAELPENSVSSPTGETISTKQYEYNLTKNIIVGDNVVPFTVEKDIAQCINFLKIKENGGMLTIDFPEGEVAQLEIISTKGKLKFSEGVVEASIKMNLVLREFVEEDEAISLFLISEEKLKEIILKTEATLTQSLKNTFQISQETNVDFLLLAEGMYRKFGYTWEKPANFLQNLEFKTSVQVTFKRG